MTILNDAVLEELGQIIRIEVSKDINQVKIEDAKIIVQALIPEIDRIVTSKVNKLIRRLAMDVISWDLVKESEEELVEENDSRPEPFPNSEVEPEKARRESLDQ